MEPGAFCAYLRSALADESDATTRRVAKRRNVYTGGSRDNSIYFVLAGQLKVTMLSAGGRECLLAIYTAGDLFGECCLAGEPRSETATAMTDTLVRQLPGPKFLAVMAKKGLVQEFVRHLAARVAEQQQMITKLATVDCEYRLADLLLRLSHKLVLRNAGGLAHRISHQELSQMVGTTRPRISELMQRFRSMGLIEITPDSRILIRERSLQEYLRTRECAPRLVEVAS